MILSIENKHYLLGIYLRTIHIKEIEEKYRHKPELTYTQESLNHFIQANKNFETFLNKDKQAKNFIDYINSITSENLFELERNNHKLYSLFSQSFTDTFINGVHVLMLKKSTFILDFVLSKTHSLLNEKSGNGFSLIHYAVFTQCPYISKILENMGADISAIDMYLGRPVDYQYILGFQKVDKPENIQVWDPAEKKLVHLPLAYLESKLDFNWTSTYKGNFDYIYHLIQVESYKQTFIQIDKIQGLWDELYDIYYKNDWINNLVLAYIDEIKGYGLFTTSDIKSNEPIAFYVGEFKRCSDIEANTYTMQSFHKDQFSIDSVKYRNLTAFINLSKTNPNVVADGICMTMTTITITITISASSRKNKENDKG